MSESHEELCKILTCWNPTNDPLNQSLRGWDQDICIFKKHSGVYHFFHSFMHTSDQPLLGLYPVAVTILSAGNVDVAKGQTPQLQTACILFSETGQ